MLIFNERFSVNPITTHIPIHKVHKLISKKKIIENVNLIKKFYRNVFKIDATIFITGLNPHCETNYEKNEENRIIIPAIRQLKKKYKNIEGPFAADSLFMKNNIKKYNVVIGMYHDQVLTPIKSLVNFKAINLTLGLPFLRISPDHGPNENMMGKNISNPESLIECIKFLNQKCI